MTEKPSILTLFSLAGKVAIVTGASRGIGLALANGLNAAGAHVIALARSPQPKEPLEKGTDYISADITLGVDKIFSDIVTKHGRLDILVNAAGITLSAGNNAEEKRKNFEQTLKTNLSSAYDCCLAARPHMKAGSSIINITSIGSVLGFPGNPAYVAAKGGLRMMSKALAVDYGTVGIRVNALAPGYIQTEMTAKSFADPGENERRRKHTCLDRWGKVEDLIGAAVFLASDASAYVTGQDLFVDGGWTAKGLV